MLVATVVFYRPYAVLFERLVIFISGYPGDLFGLTLED